MRKNKILLTLVATISLFTFGSCSNNKRESNLNSSENIGLDVSWAEGRTYLDESKLSGEDKKTTMVRVHYTREKHDYDNWNVWSWIIEPVSKGGSEYDFSMYDAYGVIADIPLIDLNTTKMGIIIRKGEWIEKDIEKDRFVTIPETTSDGIYDIYLYEGREMIYESQNDASKDTILSSYASYTRTGKLTAIINLSTKIDETRLSNVSLFEDSKEITSYETKLLSDGKMIQLLLDDNFQYDFEKQYSVKFDFGGNICKSKLVLYNLYDLPYFGEKYNYDGNDLGVTFNENKTATTFKLWAPISKSVTLNIYDNGTYSSMNKPIKKIPLEKQEKGVWSTTILEYLHGKYYTFTVENADQTSEVVDPYAKSCGLNGKRGMVVDFDQINKELNWDEVNRPYIENFRNVDASIYEMHIRDMTIDSTSRVSQLHRGKFLGLTEEGTKYTEGSKSVSTGLDHLKELGVSHVQILPFYDYNSVDESSDDQYNWGYDPLNYNCLEGSYSTDPTDGLCRIKEFKMMMKSLLKNNIQVNMDVVYNHTAENDNTNFEKIIPGYYHRLDSSLSYSNGSGCGNEMASDHYMYSKFIVDSCKFWLEEYKLSGFRFDLMGLIDTQTMENVYKECAKIYDQVMIYGEPWTGGTSSLDSNLQTNQSTLSNIDGIVGAFNDKIRNAIRGDNSPGLGWVQGEARNYTTIKNGLSGCFSGSIDPNKVINYVSCHDNYTLFDQLNLTLPKDRKNNLSDAYKQAEALIFTSQGVTFMQEGEDFLRTKSAGKDSEIHNSYKAGDHVNKMDYSLKLKNVDMFNYFKDLIQMRKENPLLRLGSNEDINSKMSFINSNSDVIAFTVKDGGNEIIVIHSLNELVNFNLDGNYQIIFNNQGKVNTSEVISSISLGNNQSVVLKRV
ncbi:MAG: type I pullulanase [Bacillales bacterium]|nr:type I pullulanase [Bacillales bacterium]